MSFLKKQMAENDEMELACICSFASAYFMYCFHIFLHLCDSFLMLWHLEVSFGQLCTFWQLFDLVALTLELSLPLDLYLHMLFVLNYAGFELCSMLKNFEFVQKSQLCAFMFHCKHSILLCEPGEIP